MLSLRRRLMLAHLGAVVVIVSSAAAAGWWQLSRAVNGQLDAALLALAENETVMLADGRGPVTVHDSGPDNTPPSLARLDRLVQIIDARGTVLARSANLNVATLPAPPALLARLADGVPLFDTLPDAREEPLRMVTVPVRAGGQLLAVQVAGSLDDIDHLMQAAALLFGTMAAALLATLGYAGARLTRGTLHAIDGMVDQAHRIGEASLHERLPHPGTDDEMGHLAGTLNAMLDRLEHAFDMQRRFTADASHELRSPMSRLRTEIEVTLRRPRAEAEYVETLRSCLDEVQHLTGLVEELLLIARFDAGENSGPSASADAATLVADCVRRALPAALEKDVAITLHAAPDLALQIPLAPATLVLTNLIDNAVKFSPPGRQVTVTMAQDGAGLGITVADQGPGIDPAELPFLFERFYRGAVARATVPGVGLGLALAHALAQQHGWRIGAANAASGGARFTLHVPLVTPPLAGRLPAP
ncbi:MAG: ATP-binding protein [Pseudomonadota bacterium]|nr:ATP-binding protein [Pseudomonadota bacterium]